MGLAGPARLGLVAIMLATAGVGLVVRVVVFVSPARGGTVAG
jgi:hypothetical protein